MMQHNSYKNYTCDEDQMDVTNLVVSPSPRRGPNTEFGNSTKGQRLSNRQLATDHRAPLHDIHPSKLAISSERNLQDIVNTMSRKRCGSPTLPPDEYTIESYTLSNTSSSTSCSNHASPSRRRRKSSRHHTRNKFLISSTDDYKKMTSIHNHHRRRRNHAVSSMDFETLLPQVLPPTSPPPPHMQK